VVTPKTGATLMRTSAGAVAVVLLGLTLGGCGAGASTHADRVGQACTEIGDVLANGPDPVADPVGYAEAQIRGLAALEHAAPSLHQVVVALDDAYVQVVGANGSPASLRVEARESAALDARCPGAAP
jgi:hypothetical protein